MVVYSTAQRVLLLLAALVLCFPSLSLYDSASLVLFHLTLSLSLSSTTSSYACDGTQQMNRTEAYFEYPALVGMLLREVR